MRQGDDRKNLSIFDFILEKMDPLIVYPEGPQRTEVRELARRTMEMLEGHHAVTAAYLGLVILHCAAGIILAHAGPQHAATFLERMIGILSSHRDKLAQMIEKSAKH